jgi:hypothetical protein
MGGACPVMPIRGQERFPVWPGIKESVLQLSLSGYKG